MKYKRPANASKTECSHRDVQLCLTYSYSKSYLPSKTQRVKWIFWKSQSNLLIVEKINQHGAFFIDRVIGLAMPQLSNHASHDHRVKASEMCVSDPIPCPPICLSTSSPPFPFHCLPLCLFPSLSIFLSTTLSVSLATYPPHNYPSV